MQNSPSTAEIRQFLAKVFSDEELTALCFDYFRDVYAYGSLVLIPSWRESVPNQA